MDGKEKEEEVTLLPCGLMNESSFGLLTEVLITKGLTEWKGHMPCGLMNESSFDLLKEGVITKSLTERKSHIYAMWPKQ